MTADFRWSSDDPSQVPFQVYTDPAVFELEQSRLFQGPVWSYLGLDCEIAHPGDFINTYVGTLPVIVNRTSDENVAAFVNRCAHRGAVVTRERRGNKTRHTCIYHHWTYDLEGNLIAVPYRNGIEGAGGHPEDFDPGCHGLRRLRTAVCHGVIFGTFAENPPALEDYLGEEVMARLRRAFDRPACVIGYQRQRIRGNWKLMVENVKDAYHGALLHAFNSRFGNFRSTQRGQTYVSANGLHGILTTYGQSGEANPEKAYKEVRSFKPGLTLEDKSVLEYVDEIGDGIVTSILSVFPNMLFLHGRNRPAIRQVRPRSLNEFDMVWTYVGYEDDTPGMRRLRLKQANFIGPAGYVSVEDSEAIELVQKAMEADNGDGHGIVALGGRDTGTQEHLVTEVAIRGFWHGYRQVMQFDQSSL